MELIVSWAAGKSAQGLPSKCCLWLLCEQQWSPYLSSDIKSGNDFIPEPPQFEPFDVLWVHVFLSHTCHSGTDFVLTLFWFMMLYFWLFYNNSQCKQTSLGFSNYYLWFLDIAALRYRRIPSFFQGHRMLTSVPASLFLQPGSGLLPNERCAGLLYTLVKLIKALPSPRLICVLWCSKAAKYG